MLQKWGFGGWKAADCNLKKEEGSNDDGRPDRGVVREAGGGGGRGLIRAGWRVGGFTGWRSPRLARFRILCITVHCVPFRRTPPLLQFYPTLYPMAVYSDPFLLFRLEQTSIFVANWNFGESGIGSVDN